MDGLTREAWHAFHSAHSNLWNIELYQGFAKNHFDLKKGEIKPMYVLLGPNFRPATPLSPHKKLGKSSITPTKVIWTLDRHLLKTMFLNQDALWSTPNLLSSKFSHHEVGFLHASLILSRAFQTNE